MQNKINELKARFEAAMQTLTEKLASQTLMLDEISAQLAAVLPNTEGAIEAKASLKLQEKQAKADVKAVEKEISALKRTHNKELKAAEKEQIKEAKLAEKEQLKQAKQAEKEAKLAERAAKKAAKEAAAEAKKAEKEANRMPTQNGITRPRPHTLCGQVWAICEEVSNQLGRPLGAAELREACEGKGFNESNIKIEYARWKKFHGLSGRLGAPKEVDAPSAE